MMPKISSRINNIFSFNLTTALLLTALYILLLHNGYWGLGFTLINSLLVVILILNPKIARSKESLLYLGLSFVLSFLIAVRSFSFGHYLSILAVLFLNSLAVTRSGEQDKPLSIKHMILSPLLVLAGIAIEAVKEINRIFEKGEKLETDLAQVTPGNTTVSLVIKGTLIAVPLIVLFTTLFALADPLFEHYFDTLVKSLNFSINLPNFADILVTAVAFGVFLSYLKTDPLKLEEFSQWQLVVKHKAELAVAVGIISVLFAVFLVIQAQYLFATDEILKAMGVTYSEYTRRGYAELLIIASISLGLTSILITKRGIKERQALKSLILLFLAEVLFLLLSATRRNFLYQDQFGFTQIRLIGFVISIWLTSILVSFALRALNRLVNGSLLPLVFTLSIGSLVLLNVLNIDYLVGKVKQPNLGYAIDYGYISQLSSDAWPAWEDTIVYLENATECRFNQEHRAILNLKDHLSVLRERSGNSWHQWGGATYPDIQAIEFLVKNEGRLQALENKFTGIVCTAD